MKLKQYCYLMRLHKPIGLFLLLWPTLWALWLASHGVPAIKIMFIFMAGVLLMRSAGCVINDVADQQVDPYVERTRDRPLASGKMTNKEALILFFILLFLAFLLVLFLNRFTILLACVGATLAMVYPFLKRFTHLPQVGLGIAFAWGVPMAFAATNNMIPRVAWEVFLAAVIWPIMYDTVYAMVDRHDDMIIGVKSTAILFGKQDRLIVGLLQAAFILVLVHIGYLFKLHQIYFVGLFCAAMLFCYQQWLIRNRQPSDCFAAFLNNNWVGMIIFIGIALS